MSSSIFWNGTQEANKLRVASQRNILSPSAKYSSTVGLIFARIGRILIYEIAQGFYAVRVRHFRLHCRFPWFESKFPGRRSAARSRESYFVRHAGSIADGSQCHDCLK